VISRSVIENSLILVGEGFWVLSAAAQLRRLVKTRNIKGLSAPSQTLNAAGNVGWCTYFALRHLWYPFATNILVLLLTVAILGYTLSNRKQFGRGLATIALVGPLTSYMLIRYPASSGWVGMAYNWLASTPWLIRIVTGKKVSGLSERALYFAVGAMICTLAYALLINAAPLIAGCLQGLVYAAVIMTYYYRHRKHD
jgi:uncharacterized protein with PQ loop repeat